MSVAQRIRPAGPTPPEGFAARVASEEQLLGGLLRNPACFEDVRGLVEAEHFSTAIGQRIFDAIAKRASRNAPCGLDLLSRELGIYQWDHAGGALAYLAELAAAPSAADPAALAHAVRLAAERPSDGLYDEDVVAWAHREAARLLDLSKRSDLPPLDWLSVIEEILSVGRSEIKGVARRIELVFVHLLKATSSPDAPSVRRWRMEVELHLEIFQRDVTAAMQRLLDLEPLWSRACREASIELDEFGERLSRNLPETCPFTLAELKEANSADQLLKRLAKR